MNSDDNIIASEVYLVKLHQEEPYLGPLGQEERVNEQGYFVRRKNRTAYPIENHSLVVRLVTNQGIEGWGETYGLVAPEATAAIIKEFLWGFLQNRNALAVESIYDDLYDLLRVRGYTGGFYHDALAAIDIALWDIKGKVSGKSLSELLGSEQRKVLSAYVSGLPAATLEQRCDLARTWQKRGFNAFKFALPVANDGPVVEIQALRNVLGESAHIACDMHWRPTSDEALRLGKEMLPYQPWFLEAPVVSEDVKALQEVAHGIDCRIAVGEEWRTIYDAKLRIESKACQIIQPEMGHTGVTQFVRICQYAQSHGLEIMPHATIGSGIFLAASLQASSVLSHVKYHEYQHSLFNAFSHYLTGNMKCDNGYYHAPSGQGIGVEPSAAMKSHMTLL